MTNKKPFYITTTLPYVNSDPHIGFAMELIRADVIARYKKLTGFDVFFNTGTDEHGLKLFQGAQAEGIDTKAYVDKYAEKFRGLKELLNISDDLHFIRTTDEHHIKAAQEFWRRVKSNGFIDKRTYQAKYCVGCELNKTNSELNEDGRCVLHPNQELELIDEENYFFKFSEFQKPLLELYEKNPSFVIPDFRFNEIKSFVSMGLEDFSISRLKTKMPWGVPVPGDSNHIMYVWFDALVNYISTLGWPEDKEQFEKYWVNGTPVQYCGKDNLRQQSAMWQAMLMAADLPNSNTIVINEFITGEGGVKMSKSLGNVINPSEIVEQYGIDALRHFLIQHIHPFKDTDFTHQRFKTVYKGVLADNLGNTVARVMRLAQDNLDKPISKPHPDYFIEYKVALSGNNNGDVNLDRYKYRIDQASDMVFMLSKKLGEDVGEEESFKVIKKDLEKGKKMIEGYVERLYDIGFLLQPFMPQTSKIILDAIRDNKKPDNLFPLKD